MTDNGSRRQARQPGEPAAQPRQRRGGLGRGLDSLIPTRPEPEPSVESDEGKGLLELSIDDITPNPYQPRTHMDRQRLEELAESIRIHGLVQPLLVARDGDRFVLIAGERRWRAARLAGLATVPVVVKQAAPQQMLELAIIENVVRADLSPLEEAVAYRQLIEEFGLSQADVAGRVGRSRVSVTNTLRLLNAPERVRDALAANQITEGHARALLGLGTAADQLAVLEQVQDRGLSVRQTEDLVRRWMSGNAAIKRDDHPRDPDEARVEDRLRTALGTRVAFRKSAKGAGGSLTIQFFSDEQLQAIYDRLVGEELW
ncbi:MAG TPA: ParB/RepB/Spo0J family partition protein [Thermomicrobiales bacterium]|nr:ParB/RepB/Spo0J family partition protein [Thermomicrobiales bacterium]